MALFWGVLSALLLVCGCSGAKMAEKQTGAAAAAVNARFTGVREACQELSAGLNGLYRAADRATVSTEGLDISQGGVFRSFQNYEYYFSTNTAGCSYYFCPGRAPGRDSLTELKLMTSAEPLIQAAYRKTSPVINVVFYGIDDPESIGMMMPYHDVVSVYPPGISFQVFEWFRRGQQADGQVVWSARPFTDLVTGWVMDVAGPIETGRKKKGVVVIGVNLRKLVAETLPAGKLPLILLAADTTVVGLNAEARRLTGLKELTDIDYVKQMKENRFAPEEYQLTHSAQPEEIRALGEMVRKGPGRYPVRLGGKKYTMTAAPVPEVKFMVVSFQKY